MSRLIVGARRAMSLALVVVAAGSTLPATAQAQLFKKLKDAAASKAAEKLGSKAVDKAAEKAGIETQGGGGRPGDAALLGEPLTADTLDMVLKGLAVMASSLDERDRLEQEQRAAHDRAVELRTHPAVQRWQERQRLVDDCSSAFFSELRDRQEEEFQKKLKSDPAKFQAEGMRFAQQIAPMQAAGDMEGVQKAQLEFMRRVIGVDPKADSAAARAKCGTVPPKPVQYAQADSMEGRAKKLLTEVRSLEAKAEEKGAAAAGIPAARFALGRERILTWLSRGSRPNGFADGALLGERKAEIEKVKRAL